MVQWQSMTKNITVLGIESSCDDTAAAVVRHSEGAAPDILSNVVYGQTDLHRHRQHARNKTTKTRMAQFLLHGPNSMTLDPHPAPDTMAHTIALAFPSTDPQSGELKH